MQVNDSKGKMSLQAPECTRPYSEKQTYLYNIISRKVQNLKPASTTCVHIFFTLFPEIQGIIYIYT